MKQLFEHSSARQDNEKDRDATTLPYAKTDCNSSLAERVRDRKKGANSQRARITKTTAAPSRPRAGLQANKHGHLQINALQANIHEASRACQSQITN